MSLFYSAGLGSAIPDTSMFQSPVYQFWAGAISANDGDSPVPFPEGLAGLSDASADGSPTFRADRGGFAAVEYDTTDGDDDGHDWSGDSQMPSGDDQFSIFALAWLKSGSGKHNIVSWGQPSSGEGVYLSFNSGSVQASIWGGANPTGASISTGQWVTIGAIYNQSALAVLSNGSQDNSESQSGLNLQDANQALGYRGFNGDEWSDIYLQEAIVCDTAEAESAFSDYHSDRLG